MIEIRNLTKTKIDAALLQEIAEKVLRAERQAKRPSPLVKGLGLSVAFVGPGEAQKLNMKYRKKTYVPNVLSFDYGPPPFGRRGSPLWGGEIILCPATIRKDARKYGTMFQEELARVFVHGLLHLLGYTHKQMQTYV